MTDKRKDCPMRHENGNCTVAGGFCTAVNDPICEALHNAYDFGHREAALREQEERRWIPASEPPKDSDHVLVCTKHRKPFKARYYPDRKRWDVSGSVVITHWMPLPEPPKEDAR